MATTLPPQAVMTAPPGLHSNFDNPPTLMGPVIATSTVLLVLTTSLVIARAYVKTFLVRRQFIEDYLCYGAWAGLCAYIGVFVHNADFGYARHMWDVTPPQFMRIMYLLHVMYALYSPITLAAKLSVLLQIKRIFTTKERTLFWWVIWGSIIANVLFYAGLFFSYVFQCHPREKIWNSSVEGHCVDAIGLNLASGILNVISDIETLLLPVWGIWNLQMPTKKKVGVLAVFGVGSIACVIGVVGIYYRVLLLREPDFTWICTQAALLVITEMAVVIFVGCFPSLPRLVRHIKGQREASRSYSTEPKSYPPKLRNDLNSFAKYMGPRTDLTGTRTETQSNEHLELYEYTISRETGKDTKMAEDVERGNILKTVTVEQGIAGPGSRP